MTVAQREDLQALKQCLQQRLQFDIPWGETLKIGCAMSDDTLVILTQHAPGLSFDPEITFNALKKALQSLKPQVTQPVKLYLRVAGEKQAYAKYDFTLQPVQTVATNASISRYELNSLREEAANLKEPVQWDQTHEQTIGRNAARHSTDLKNWHRSSTNLGQQGIKPGRFSSFWRSLLSDIPTPLLVVGGGVALATLFTSIYMLTRPCVIGQCQFLETAQQLNKVAEHLTRQADSQVDLLSVQQQLVEANNYLKEVPRWSFRYQEAKHLAQNLSNQWTMLNQMSQALEQAASAWQGQNPPHTTQEWQVTRTYWQQAIATLANIPANSALFGLAQQKIPQYQAKLQVVNQYLNLEQEASKKLLLAKNTSLLAQTRGNTAMSLQTWQKVKATWDSAINTLAAIPKTTTAYQEAQQLKARYRTELAAASDRVAKEQMAAKAYSEAISKANLAQRDEQQNQISKAVTNWNQALNFGKQVPNGTQYYRQVQPLITSYSSAIQQAEAKLKVANVLQKARSDLNRTCSGNIQVCKYAANSELILVQLSSSYEKAVERKYASAKFQRDLNTQADVVIHYRTLKQALEAISGNANIPLQVYESDGSPLYSYKPK
jgi:hypothetical protein